MNTGLQLYALSNSWYELEAIKTLGDCIRFNRLKNNLTQAELSIKIGINKNTLYMLEKIKLNYM